MLLFFFLSMIMVSATTGGKKERVDQRYREFDDLLSVMASVFLASQEKKIRLRKKVKSHAMCERTRTSKKKKKKKKKKKTTQKRKY